MAQARIKMNLREEKRGLDNRVYVLWNRAKSAWRDLTFSARAIAEKIFSFSTSDKSKSCRLTYAQIEEEFGYSHATCAEALSQIRDYDFVEKGDRDQDGTEYKFIGTAFGKKYYVIPQYLYTAEVLFKKEWRRLTSCEIRVLAYLMTECSSAKNGGNAYGGGVCRVSYKKMARLLGICEKSVRKAIKALMNEAHLVHRPACHKGVNGARVSAYEVSSMLYEYKRYKKKAKTPAEENAARARYYDELRKHAEERAERYLAIARKDPKFNAVHTRFRALDVEIAKAELFRPETVAQLNKEKAWKREERRVILAKLGLSESDIQVQCNCRACRDTGQVNGAWCTCYPGGVL